MASLLLTPKPLLGKRIKEMRSLLGMSQAELAARCKTSAQYLSQIENGKKQVSLQTLVAIAAALQVTLDNLLVGNQVDSIAEYNAEIEMFFKDCTPYEKRVLYEMLGNMKTTLRDNKELLQKEIEKY